MEANITFKGVELRLEYYVESGCKQTLEDEGAPDYMVIEEIFIGEQDCTELLEDQMEQIEDKLIDYLSD